MKRRVVPVPAASKEPAAPIKTELFKGMRHLLQHLTCTAYEEGGERVPGWIQLRVDRGEWTIRLSDPDSSASLTVRAPTIDMVFSLAETLLGDRLAPWQPDKWLAMRSKKKRH